MKQEDAKTRRKNGRRKPSLPFASSRLLVKSLPLLAVAMLGVLGCEEYFPPPTASIEGEVGGLLSDPSAPLVVAFSEAIDPNTLHVTVAFDQSSTSGGADSGAPPPPPLYTYDPINGETGGMGALDAQNQSFTITPNAALPVGSKLVLIVQPGLAGVDGRTVNIAQQVPFSYAFQCAGGKGTALLKSGTYFFLLQVETPITTQIQLWASLDIDPKTGLFVGQFTKAKRNPAPNRCPSPCDSTEVCRLLPSPTCVVPSTAAGSVDEFSDYIVNDTPPTGFSFTVNGCAEDGANGTVGVSTAPADMVVQSPAVVVGGLTMNASFAADATGVVRTSGSLQAQAITLGTLLLGAGTGTATARSITTDQSPTDVPSPLPGAIGDD